MIDNESQYHFAKNFALKKLALRSRFSLQLEQLLIDEGIELNIVKKVLEECKGLGYLNDEDWMNNRVQEGLRKRDGPRKLLEKLKLKGVNEDKAQQVISQNFSQEKQVELIQLLLFTRYRHKDFLDWKERQKVIASLMRKGFDLDAIHHSLKSLNKNFSD